MHWGLLGAAFCMCGGGVEGGGEVDEMDGQGRPECLVNDAPCTSHHPLLLCSS